MIELRSGVPGSGKTLNAVVALFRLVARWEKNPEEARPIFVLGIPELNIPHSLVPLKSVQINKAGAPSLVPDWDSMPDGSLVLIDECQGVFPPRSTASQAPEHVAWLNVHRHRGFDIWLITQHPKLIDVSVRALVGKHQHFRRLFGGQRAAVYEWDACSDSLSGTKSAVISRFEYPKKAFLYYKSAEIHNKQSFKLPRWLLIPLAGLVLVVIFVPRAFSVIYNGATGKGTAAHSQELAPGKTPGTFPGKPPEVSPGQNSQGKPVLASVPVLPEAFNSSARAVDKVVDRPIEQLKLSHGIYGDDPRENPHYSDEQLRIQRASVRVLNQLEDQKLAMVEYAARKDDYVIPVTFVPPHKVGSYK